MCKLSQENRYIWNNIKNKRLRNYNTMAKNKGGRPTSMTPETLRKLEEVFAIGGTDEEACFYADISKETLYEYQRKHPEYTDRKEALKQKPILKARQTVVKALDDADNAQWYLERKNKKEFSSRQEIDIQGELKISKLEEIQKQTQEILSKRK